MDQTVKIPYLNRTDTDVTRIIVIVSFILSVTAVTVLAISGPAALIVPQLYYFPVLYTCYHYPRQGIWLAGICALVYEMIAISFTYPVFSLTALAIGQAVLFIGIGAVVAHSAGEQKHLLMRIVTENERRRGVICTVAHELRTPLQPIMGYLNLLLQDPEGFGINEKTAIILNRCLLSVERERQIINQMLEFSVLESGKLRLRYSVFSVENMLSSIISVGDYSTKAEITQEIPAGLTFDADENAIRTAIDSILSNAVTYSRPPRNIRISYLPDPLARYHLLAIRDNGIGIDPAYFSSIFEPFHLTDSNKLSRKYERIGLSLSIAKKYVQMHWGDITVESTVNQGSTFTIHLPKERVAEGISDEK